MGYKNIDRLSGLPDEVLLYILDFIPTKSFVRTCILSKRWRHTWKYVTNLHFDDIHSCSGVDSFTKYVDRVLELYKTTRVNSFRLDFSNMWVPFPSTRSLKWIEEAVKLNVSELEMHYAFLELPRPFICKTLTKLTLVCNRHYDNWNITSPIYLPLLKTLDISVSTNPHHNAFKIIHGCPLLERLSLAVTISEGDEDYIFNIPTLKRLKLKAINYMSNIKVVLNVPGLKYFILDEPLLLPFVMDDFPPLVSVTLSRLWSPNQSWIELLRGISRAKSLTMHGLYLYPSESHTPKFLNLKHLEFRGSYYYPLDFLLINQIIESSNELEHLCIKEHIGPYCNQPIYSHWIEPQSVPTCMLNSLRTIKLVNFKGREPDIQFMAYILRNALVLKTLTIMCDSFPLEKEMRLNAELLKLPQVSKYCEVHFIASRSRSAST